MFIGGFLFFFSFFLLFIYKMLMGLRHALIIFTHLKELKEECNSIPSFLGGSHLITDESFREMSQNWSSHDFPWIRSEQQCECASPLLTPLQRAQPGAQPAAATTVQQESTTTHAPCCQPQVPNPPPIHISISGSMGRMLAFFAKAKTAYLSAGICILLHTDIFKKSESPLSSTQLPVNSPLA